MDLSHAIREYVKRSVKPNTRCSQCFLPWDEHPTFNGMKCPIAECTEKGVHCHMYGDDSGLPKETLK